MAVTAADLEVPGSDPRLPRARAAVLASLGAALLTSLTMPGIGLLFERDVVWIVLGSVGILTFVLAQGGVLYASVTPWLGAGRRRWLLIGFAAAAVLSVPLVGPLGPSGDEQWETWAWLGGSIIGSVPLLVRRWAATAAMAATVAVVIGLAWWTDGSTTRYVLIAVSVGLTTAAMTGLPLWLWSLLEQARAGRTAQARLAAAEERLRFARDVHDLFGHNLSVIALKAELAARLAPVDPARAAAESAQVQVLAAAALTQTREAMHGYRAVDLGEQVTAIAQVLRSSGIRCTVSGRDATVPPEVAVPVAAVLREASTNILRHSRARWCTIAITRDPTVVRMTVANDGADGTGPDRHSSGLRGLSERLADAGGSLRSAVVGDVFTLEVAIPVVS